MKLSPAEVDRQLETLVPQENETQRILRDALRRLGPNGENWGHFNSDPYNGERVCVIGALDAVATYWQRERIVSNFINPIIGPQTETPHCERAWPMFWNDRVESFADIRAMFERAITLAGQSCPP